MNPDKTCKCRENHLIHICQLRIDGDAELIEVLTNTPKVKCEICGAEANTGSYVCLPIDLSPQGDKPNQEGLPSMNCYVRCKTDKNGPL
jgi:hypothetical protein